MCSLFESEIMFALLFDSTFVGQLAYSLENSLFARLHRHHSCVETFVLVFNRNKGVYMYEDEYYKEMNFRG